MTNTFARIQGYRLYSYVVRAYHSFDYDGGNIAKSSDNGGVFPDGIASLTSESDLG